MLLNEFIIQEGFGRHGFPGFGQGIFRQAYYEFIASQIARYPDETIRLDLGEWFSNAFRRDSGRFKEDIFMRWVRENKRGGRGEDSAKFQQRHFYYFAYLIKTESDPERRKFLADWMGEMFRYNNNNFDTDRWAKHCGVDEE